MTLALYSVLDQAQLVLQNLFAPDNPFVPWMLVFNLVLVLVHIYMIWWVYRDALWRYNRGAPWATLAAVFPVGGWLFYLLYRASPLVEFDRIEAETFEEAEHEWTDYDLHRKSAGQLLFSEIGSLVRGEGSGYSAHIRASRLRELGIGLSPQEREQRRRERIRQRATAALSRRERRDARLRQKLERQEQARARELVVTPHGFTGQMGIRKQRAMRRKLEVLEKLKTVPRQDPHLEELIFEQRYPDALKAAEEGLGVAREMSDPQGVVTYESYIERLQKLIKEGQGGAAAGTDGQ